MMSGAVPVLGRTELVAARVETERAGSMSDERMEVGDAGGGDGRA